MVNPTFTAPRELTADVVLSFRLLVTDPGGRFDKGSAQNRANLYAKRFRVGACWIGAAGPLGDELA